MSELLRKTLFRAVASVAAVGLLSLSVAAQQNPSEPPFKTTPCNMNCLDTGTVVPAPPVTDPAQDRGRHRLIVLSDMGADNDDSQSLVRLLLYANEIDIEGLVATTSTYMMDRTHRWLIEDRLKAYAQVRPNLLRHDEKYPTAESLQAVTKTGIPEYGMGGVGRGKDSEGSDLILASLRKRDTRPLWISIWGGSNTLAQALWKLRSTEKPEVVQRLVGKLRVYAIGDQDDAGFWLRREFPGLLWITPKGYNTGITATDPESNPEMISSAWLAKNIQQGHGSMGRMYPDVAYGMEGDTPAFLNLIPNGMNDPSRPGSGGWGGRFSLYTPSTPTPMPSRPGVPPQSVVVPVQETRAIWTASDDQYTGPMTRQLRRLPGAPGPPPLPKDAAVAVWRWREDFQNDFAARMEWTTKPPAETNHPPTVVLAANTPEEFTVHSGQEFHLNATGSHDPDGDSLSYFWFQYVEASEPAEPVNIAQFSQVLADFPVRAPVVSSPRTVHFICRVVDRGTPPLARYKRVVVHILP